MTSATRLEHDLLGELEIPADAYWGIHTARAVANFDLRGRPMHPEFIRCLALVKKACAQANMRAGILDHDIGNAICAACDEVAQLRHQPGTEPSQAASPTAKALSPPGTNGTGAGQVTEPPATERPSQEAPSPGLLPPLHTHFPVDALQGGAGTSTNMNMNEVLANRAIELLGGVKGDYSRVHPNDHVNLSQSTNDVFPTAVKVAAIRMMHRAAEAMTELQNALQKKETEFARVLKLGRTEMQDAVPVTGGQMFAAWAQAIQRDWWRLWKMEERLRQVNLGGTALGTGLNAPLKYVHSVVEHLRDLAGIGLARAENLIDCTQNCDPFVEASGMLKAAAVDLAKIAADLRILSSGPRGGFGELRLPPLQAGSSIMPGKVNPVATEAVTQAAFQVMANDQAITLAAQAGQLELNAFIPLIADNLFESLDLTERATRLLTDKCIAGIEVDEARCRTLLENSAALATAMVPHLGYEKATEIAKRAVAGEGSVPELLLAEGLLDQEQLQALTSPEQLTTPGVVGAKLRR